MIVADASAVLEILLSRPAADTVAAHLLANGQTIHVPHLVDIEVVHALRWYSQSGGLNPSRAQQALDFYADLTLVRHAHYTLLDRIWQLRHNATVYDAAYLALAEALGAPLVTCDRPLRAAPGHHAKVVVC